MPELIDRIASRLREAREEAGLTQQQVADWLGVRRPGVAEIEAGKRAVKSEELARLSSLYGRSLSWLGGFDSVPEDRISGALFRTKTGNENSPADATLRREAHLLVCRCRLLAEAESPMTGARAPVIPEYPRNQALYDYSDSSADGRAVAYQERRRLGLGVVAPLSDVWGIVERAGLRVFPLELGTAHPVDGIFAILDESRACVGVNVDKWYFRQIFTVVHEYAHALFDRSVGSDVCNTSCGWSPARDLYSNRELRANQFAAVFLAPREALEHYLEGLGKLRAQRHTMPTAVGLTPVDVVRAQDYFGASAEMLLWRLRNENFITSTERHRILKEIQAQGGVIRLAETLGYQWRRRAQPVPRAYEVALAAYSRGTLSLGEVAEIFGHDKAAMLEKLAQWGVAQEFGDDDALLGAAHGR